MKSRIKIAKFYYKISMVMELIKQLGATGLNVAFDNTQTNNYKILFNDNEYCFKTYDDILNCLSLLIDIRKGRK